MAGRRAHLDYAATSLGRWLRHREKGVVGFAAEMDLPYFSVARLLGSRARQIVRHSTVVRVDYNVLRVVSARTGIPVETLMEEAEAAYGRDAA